MTRNTIDKKRRRQSMKKGGGSIMFESRHWPERECLDSNISALVAIITPVDSSKMRLDQINGAEAESAIGLNIAPLHHELWSTACIGRFPNHGLINYESCLFLIPYNFQHASMEGKKRHRQETASSLHELRRR
jgi:hypothetical protein